MFFLFTETAEYLCIFQSKTLHLTKTHNSEDCFILLLREFLGFFPQKMSAMLCFFCSFFSFFLYRKNLSQLLPLLFHWTENSLAFRCILYYAECFLLHWENILNLCFKLCHLFFWGEAPLHKMKNLIYFKISKGYFCPWYYYKFYLCSRLFPHTFTSLTLKGNKITATNLNFIHLSYLGSSFLATITVSDKTLACTPVYSLKLVNVQFTFWVRAHLSSTEILPVALVKVCFSQMALVMSSYPSCSRSASISKFVEVKVTQQNVWMTSRV